MPALAVAYVIAYWVTLVVTWLVVKRRLAGLPLRALTTHALRMLAVSAPAAALAWWVADVLTDLHLRSWERLLPVTLAGLAALMLVVLVGRALRLPEFALSLRSLRTRLKP
ncbi:MAG: hypothetical protein EB027_03810 [Actinobacteria bacterium]|nr:hypothetical protein [Actinomycetota bacterium]